MMKWNKISDVGYPENNSRVLVWDTYWQQAKIYVCNHNYKCWDDEDGDDCEFKWDIDRAPAWCEIEHYIDV